MKVNIRIKQAKKLFKKGLNIWNIIELWESSCTNANNNKSLGLIGIYDDFYRIDSDFLNPTKENGIIRNNKINKSNSFILFDRFNLNLGIGISLNNNDIVLTLTYPSTLSEIRNFYTLIQKTCREIGTNVFYRNTTGEEEAFNIIDLEKLINVDYENSYNCLKQIYYIEDLKTFSLFPITNPVILDKKFLETLGINNSSEDSEVINNIMNKYETALNDIQKTNRYYSVPSCYRMDNNFAFCIYPIPPECETIVPVDPESDLMFYKKITPIFSNINTVNKYYAVVEYNKKRFQIEYEKFIENFANENREYYDTKHIIIEYSDADIKDLIENGNAEEIKA